MRRFAAQSHARGLQGRSIQRRLAALRTFFGFLLREGALKRNPALEVPSPKASRRLPQTLDVDQMARLLALEPGDALAARDLALMELLYSSGLRLAELTSLRLKDLDLASASVRVLGKGRKERICPVGSKAIAALRVMPGLDVYKRQVRDSARDAAIERVLDALLPKPRMLGFSTDEPAQPRDAETRAKLRDLLTRGELDDREVEIEVRSFGGVDIMAPPGMEEMQQQLQSVLSNLGGNRTRTRRVKVREALKVMLEEEAGKLINEEELKTRALSNAEQNGIVFIDEIDKIARRQETLSLIHI